MPREPLGSSASAFTQSFWEVRGVSIVSLVHLDTARFIACLCWQLVSEDCKNCALLRTLAARRGLPASAWSVSSAGLLLESDSSNESVLGFQSGGAQPPSARRPGELSVMLKMPGALRIGRSSLSKGSQNSLHIIYLWLQFIKKGTRLFQPINCQRNTYLR